MRKILFVAVLLASVAVSAQGIQGQPTGRQVLTPTSILAAGDMSLASLTSSIISIQRIDNVAVQLTWTGNAVGTFAVQVSNDQSGWSALDTSGAPSISGTAGTIMLDLNLTSAPYLRVVYTRTSGTGALTVIVSGKGI